MSRPGADGTRVDGIPGGYTFPSTRVRGWTPYAAYFLDLPSQTFKGIGPRRRRKGTRIDGIPGDLYLPPGPCVRLGPSDREDGTRSDGTWGELYLRPSSVCEAGTSPWPAAEDPNRRHPRGGTSPRAVCEAGTPAATARARPVQSIRGTCFETARRCRQKRNHNVGFSLLPHLHGERHHSNQSPALGFSGRIDRRNSTARSRPSSGSSKGSSCSIESTES